MIRETGFTIIELLIAMAITSVVSTAIYTAFQSQQQSYITQDNVVEMQQNLRAAMNIMVREIRMAGYDPTWEANADIVIAGPNSIHFTKDISEDGDTNDANENITFGFSNLNDSNTDGIADNGAALLGRDTGGGFHPMADNIHAIAFAYAFDSDENGNLDTYDVAGNEQVLWAVDSDGDNNLDTNLDSDGDGDIDADDGPGAGGNGVIGGQPLVANVVPANIRAVRIWILARSRRGDKSFLNTRTYVVGNKVITPDSNNDNCRMRLLTTIVKCRNMGLN